MCVVNTNRYKILEKYEGEIHPLVIVMEKEDFKMIAKVQKDLEYLNKFNNFVIFHSAYTTRAITEELNSKSAFEFLDKALEEHEVYSADEL